MIDKNIFKKLNKELSAKDQMRERVIIESRPILKNSKSAIYALHKDDMKQAESNLDAARRDIEKLKKIIEKNQELAYGIYISALQEYTEAVTYYHFLKDKKLIGNDTIGVDAENYLLGICDLTGELTRRAVFSVVNERYKDIPEIKDFVEIIHNEFLEFELRNGELRKKSDSIKYNLKKIEEILYELKLREKL